MDGKKLYLVKPKDTLWKIAKQFHMSVKQLMELNGLTSTLLSVGQILLVQEQKEEKEKLEESYQEFLARNQGTGTLKVQVYIGNTYFPIADAHIEIFKIFTSGKQTFFEGQTEQSGLIDSIPLPSPLKRSDYLNGASSYQIKATHPNYEDTFIEEVSIYDGIKSIQKIEMFPKGYSVLKGKSYGD